MKTAFVSFALVFATLTVWAENNPFIARPSVTRYGTQSVGRFLYTGDVPKILNAADIEVHVSKLMLTVRVKGWVSEEQRKVYPSQLLLHWNAVRQAFATEAMSFEPLVDTGVLAAAEKKAERKAQWLLVA